MAEFTFKLLIKRGPPEDTQESLTCRGLLRVVRRKRRVYDALWGSRDVIVKVFSHNIKAKYHLKREWRGLKTLQERGLNSPAPLFFGQTQNNEWAMVAEKIGDSSTVLDIFLAATK